MEDKEDLDDKTWELVFRTKDETITIGIPKTEISKIAQALYDFAIDNKINLTLNKTKNEILN